MLKALFIFGTRPEAIKLIPVIKAFQVSNMIETKICLTAQHREMVDQVLTLFDIIPDYDLDLMKVDQDLYRLTSQMLTSLKTVLEIEKPDYIFVHGDTTTTMAASLAGFYHQTTVCHVEAGLRTYDKGQPFPEELNRQITGRIADHHFAPTEQAKGNLLKEHIPKDNILVTGNTVIDALQSCLEIISQRPTEKIKELDNKLNLEKDLILVTAHRRENHGQGITDICQALIEISKEENVQIIFPVHLNPKIRGPVFELLSDSENIYLHDPLPYEAFVWLMNHAKIIITDSGGIQEEAPSLSTPVLVMRDTTERPEAIAAGTVKLVGASKDNIVSECLELLRNKEQYEMMSHQSNPYGDGKAAQRILDYILKLKKA